MLGPSSYAMNASATFLRKDRKSTRLNSSHRCISYAVFCLKKKKSPTPFWGMMLHLEIPNPHGSDPFAVPETEIRHEAACTGLGANRPNVIAWKVTETSDTA